MYTHQLQEENTKDKKLRKKKQCQLNRRRTLISKQTELNNKVKQNEKKQKIENK